VVLIAAVAVLFALAPVACGHQGAAPGERSVEAPRPDGGLPPPPAASRKGITVPSDLGFGAGPAGPSTNSGTPPATPPPAASSGP
jgi:hypothetical protein